MPPISSSAFEPSGSGISTAPASDAQGAAVVIISRTLRVACPATVIEAGRVRRNDEPHLTAFAREEQRHPRRADALGGEREVARAGLVRRLAHEERARGRQVRDVERGGAPADHDLDRAGRRLDLFRDHRRAALHELVGVRALGRVLRDLVRGRSEGVFHLERLAAEEVHLTSLKKGVLGGGRKRNRAALLGRHGKPTFHRPDVARRASIELTPTAAAACARSSIAVSAGPSSRALTRLRVQLSPTLTASTPGNDRGPALMFQEKKTPDRRDHQRSDEVLLTR